MRKIIRIGIEGSSFTNYPGGIGRYVLSMMDFLGHEINVEFIVFANRPVYLPVSLQLTSIVVIEPLFLLRRIPNTIWLKLFAGRLIRPKKLDLYISTAGFLPSGVKGLRTISIIHDLNYLVVPKTMGRMQCLSFHAFFSKDIRRTNFIVCNSSGTSQRLLESLGRSGNCIVNPPVSADFTSERALSDDARIMSYGIDKPYFLTVGTLEPRKNLSMSIRVFISMKKEGLLSNCMLILVGGKGWRDKQILKLIHEHSSDVVQLGYVSDSDLPILYRNAELFLFPSQYEGFGMPVREAVYSGCRVVASDIPELLESGFREAVYFDPKSPEQYSVAILTALKTDKTSVKLVPNKELFSTQMESVVEYITKRN